MINGPGATGTDWRVHALWDPSGARLSGVQLTDNKIGEGFGLHALSKGDLVLGDRGYAYARSIDAAVQKKAEVVVRFNPQTVRLCSQDRTPLNLLKQARSVPAVGVKSWLALLPVPPRKKNKSKKSWLLADAIRWIPVRLAAARTRRRKVIWILTTLVETEITDAEVMDLYRLRWQIELAFKRLKTLAGLDELPSMKGPTARSWILARLLMATLAQRIADPASALSPWGYVLE